MLNRGLMISLIILVSATSYALFKVFVINSDFSNYQTSGVNILAQNRIKQLQDQVAQLSKIVNQQQMDYQKLKSEINKLSSSVNQKGNVNNEVGLVSSKQKKYGITKEEFHNMFLSMLEETLVQQNEVSINQQQELDELKKAALTEPEQVKHYEIDRLAEKLHLSEVQKDNLQQMIEDYTKKQMESNQQIAMDFEGNDAEDIENRIARKLNQETELTLQFEEDLMSILDDNQVRVYRTLPLNERKILGNRFFSQSDFEPF